LAAKLHRDKQFQACEEIATYLKDGTIDIATSLNAFDQVLPFLLPVPNTRFFKVVFGVGTGSLLKGPTPQTFCESILVLAGDFEEGVQFPNVISLPSSSFQTVSTKVPSYRKVEQVRL